MIVNLVERYDKLVQAWSVREFYQVGPNLRFKGKVIFIDDSVLFIRQVVLGETTFKYAYHWQNREGQLISRWDNSPHWPEVATYPHHKHIMKGNEIVVRESHGGDLEQIFEEIAKKNAWPQMSLMKRCTM